MQTIEITLPESVRIDIQGIKDQIQELKKDLETKKTPKYYTRKQLADLFDVNISTIHNWRKNGVVKSVGIGSRVYFTQEAVDAALVNLNN
ncbi:helix-turn-helix domain-containing protein [Leeuwenhoekiella marinoflava]|uniref:helix-turn-helix domain-containing protein n=1 Tax=Leeuwenhoekiella marinoflava TaxID=988 RepID=UPI003001D8FB